MTGLLCQDIKGLEQFADTVQRKETGLHGDDRFRASLQRVESEEADVRWAIDNDIIVVVPEAGQGVRQDVLPADLTCECLRYPTQQNVGRSHVKVLANGPDDVTKNRELFAGFLHEYLVHGPRRMHSIGEKSQSGMALRVHVHEQNSSLLAGEKGRKVDGCDRLSTPTLLVHDRYRAHTHSFSRCVPSLTARR